LSSHALKINGFPKCVYEYVSRKSEPTLKIASEISVMFSEVNKTYHIVYSVVNIKCMFLFNLMSKIMEFLIEQFQQKLKYTSLTFVRSILDDINWEAK